LIVVFIVFSKPNILFHVLTEQLKPLT